MIPIAVGNAQADILGDKLGQWQIDQRWRTYRRLSDQIRLPDGTRYAWGKDGDSHHLIPGHEREDTTRLETRRRSAKVPRWTSAIADHYIAHIWRRPATRQMDGGGELTPAAEYLIADADGWGTRLTKVLHGFTRRAFIDEVGFLLADREGDRYVFREIDPDAVWRADVMPGGRVTQAAMRLRDADGRWFLWLVDERATQRAWLDDDGAKITSIDPPVAHAYGDCPLVRMAGLPSIAGAVADCQRRAAEIDSLLMSDLRNNGVTWYYGSGIPDPAALPKLVKSEHSILAFQDPQAKIAPITGDISVSERLADEREKAKLEMYQVAKVQPVSAEPGQAESGLARQYRFVDAEVELAAVADAVESAENRLWVLWANAMGQQSAPPVADYPDDFAPTNADQRLTRTDSVLRSRLPMAIKRAEVGELVDDLYPDLDRDAVMDEVTDPGGFDGLS